MKKFLLLMSAAAVSLSGMAFVKAPKLNQGQNYAIDGKVKQQLISASAANVVSETQLAPGVIEQVCATRDGGLVKRIVKNGKSVAAKSYQAPVEAAEGATLSESFEGWDGLRANWIPAGWSEQNSDGKAPTLENGKFTWHVGAQEGSLLNPIDGNYYAIIYYAYEKDENNQSVDLPQDEWLISPAMTLRKNEMLSFYLGYNPLYLYDMSNENLDWTNRVFKNRIVSATLTVWVRETGGEWVQIYDVEPQWSDKELGELFDNYSSSGYEKVQLSLADYEGKEVQVAFRYAGIRGNSMVIDNVVVDQEPLLAKYDRPYGSLFLGYSEDLDSSIGDEENDYTFMYAPAYTTLTWNSVLSSNITSHSWAFGDNTSSEASIETEFAPSRKENYYTLPSLSATADGYDDITFTYPVHGLYVGGGGDLGTKSFPLTRANLEKDGISLLYNSQSIPLSGYYKYTNTVWTQMFFGKTPTETDYLETLGFLTKFEKPAKPCIIKRVWVMAYGLIQDDSKLSMVLYRCAPNNMPYGAFASAECGVADMKVLNFGGSYNYYMIPFDFTVAEGENPILLDRDIFAMVYDLNSNENNIIYLVQTLTNDANDDASQYIYFTGKENGEDVGFVFDVASLTNTSGEPTKTHLYMELEVEDPWLKALSATEVELGAAGGTAELAIDTYYDAADLTYSVVDGAGNAADWATVIGAGSNAEGKVSVTLGELAEGATERVAKVTISSPTCSDVVFTVKQSAGSGVEVVEANPMKVTVKGGNIVVANAEGEVVVYDVAGKVVATATANGSAVIPATDLEGGVYVVSVAGKAVKVIK